MIKFIYVVLTIVFLLCCSGYVENSWAASFRDKHYGIYITRMYVSVAGAILSLAAIMALSLWRKRKRN